MWITDNYRRNLLDMHISDAKPEYLSKINVLEYVGALQAAGVQSAIVKAKPHTGLCYYPTKIGEMHSGLKGRDYFGETLEVCHRADIKVTAYLSQIYDNWAYEKHPAWRLVDSGGKNWQEIFEPRRMHQTSRYGILCPNNEEYRAYVAASIRELNENYCFEGMFLDMAFWPEVCYCPVCREKFYTLTGEELPRTINWSDPLWLAFNDARNQWMLEFVQASTEAAKAINPQVTIEHNHSIITGSWRMGCSELLTEVMDFASGDYYGGFLQQSFICKYYRSVSKLLPFNYHTSRCNPSLEYHTTTKEPEELIATGITALVHNGAFCNVDAINPDGSIDPAVYHNTLKMVFQATRPYEKYVGGRPLADVAVLFSTHTKPCGGEDGLDVSAFAPGPAFYYSAPVAMCGLLRQANIPFDVVGSRNLTALSARVLVLAHVARLTDAEMDAIEQYVRRGGSLYVSGCIGHPGLERLLGLRATGQTAHSFTYIAPWGAGVPLLADFTEKSPLSVPMAQYTAEVEASDCEVLGTLVLPYTMTGNRDFAAIHSNPPGEYTGRPALVRRRVGKGNALWAAAALETTLPHSTKRTVLRLIHNLFGEGTYAFASNAPAEVEVVGWEKEGKLYFALINQQDAAGYPPVYDLYLEVPGEAARASLPEKGAELRLERMGTGTRIHLPRLDLFCLVEVS